MTAEGDLLKYASFRSQVDPSFWQRLTELKLDVDKLNENVHRIWGYYSNKKPEGQNQLFSVDASSFNKFIQFAVQDISLKGKTIRSSLKAYVRMKFNFAKESHKLANYANLNILERCLAAKIYYSYHSTYFLYIIPDQNRLFGIGSIINKNTIDSFKDEDKLEILKQEGKEMMNIIKEKALEQPSLLTRFLIFSFANLKTYQYFYWFAFPAPTFLSCKNLKCPENIKEIFSDSQIKHLCDVYDKYLDNENKAFFLVKSENKSLKIFTLKEGLNKIRLNEDWFLAFSDTSEAQFPSWPLRNFIALVSYHCTEFVKHLRIICLRLHYSENQWRADNSVILNVSVNLEDNAWVKAETGEYWVGWEKNEKGRMGPRLANLKQYMDPVSLAESSVDLNLKLIKWQIFPDLNLEIIKSSKCLLIGAGTLGCTIARNLMCWGVRHITFIDYGTISYSNPVRQCLYKFLDSGKNKAETAAASLKEIFPGMVSSGYTFAIPMPGHPVGESLITETEENVRKLENLIDEHDAIFLLMDSRESRWLPTLLTAAKQKLTINAALGFDSYLVMRHGMKISSEDQTENQNSKFLSGDKLGCYFCSDVTAPGNSFKGRTLDQQCTVTRPGVSNMAGALAVELFVSILQHPLLGLAPAESNCEISQSESLLGLVPHSIRGFISHYQTVLPAVERYLSCVACSWKVIEKYKEEGFDFILKCLESKEYLEELCGLTALHNESLLSEVLECSDTESDDCS